MTGIRIPRYDFNVENIFLNFCKENDVPQSRADVLAYKLLTGKVSVAEKAEIYTLLTGREAPIIKGRGTPRKHLFRDVNIALQHLYNIYKLSKLRGESIDLLADQHGLDKTTIEDSISTGIKEYKRAALELMSRYRINLEYLEMHGTFLLNEDDKLKTDVLKREVMETEYMKPIIAKYEAENKIIRKRYVK